MGPGATLRARTPSSRWPRLERLQPDTLAWVALAGLLVVAAAFIYYETRGTTFWIDEWTWALERRTGGLDSLLRPHNGHFSLIPVLLYKLLFATAGLGDYRPYRAMVIVGHLGCVVLLFAYVRRRVGSYFALLAAALILFFGAAWQDILWPFQIAWLISLAAGLGALLMLDRRDRLGDSVACGLLAIALASSGLGVAIALGVAVEVLWGRRRWRDAWIVAAPLAVYALWWLGYGNSHDFMRHNILLAPTFVADAAAGALGALTGLTELTSLRPDIPLAWGRPLAILAVGVLIWRMTRLRPIPPRIVTLLTIVVAFWTLTALNRAQISTPFESRYLYVGALFVLLVAVELARGATASRRVHVVLTGVVAAAIVSNVGVLRDNARTLKAQAQAARADLGGLEIARGLAKPNLVLTDFPGFPFLAIKAGPYLTTARAVGSPAYTAAEIATAPEGPRHVADLQLIAIHQVGLRPVATAARLGNPPRVDSVAAGAVGTRGACLVYRPSGTAAAGATNAVDVTVPGAGLLLRAQGGSLTVSVRRFGDEWKPVGRVTASAAAVLRIGPDSSPRPWHARVAPADRTTVCGLA